MIIYVRVTQNRSPLVLDHYHQITTHTVIKNALDSAIKTFIKRFPEAPEIEVATTPFEGQKAVGGVGRYKKINNGSIKSLWGYSK